MDIPMKQSTENYLKAIVMLDIPSTDEYIKISDVSKRLNVSAPAVTDMVKKLEAEKFVKSKPYKGIKVTLKGKTLGLRMIRHHRLWEAYLHQELGLPWDTVHDEAERLEHACSDDLINKIEEKLGFPKFDPHGNPIPDRNGDFPKTPQDIPLSTAQLGHLYTITRVVDVGKEFLNYIDSQGLHLGATLTITSRLSLDNSLICQLNAHSFTLSHEASRHIFVV